MKEVFVLYGRRYFHEGILDHDGNYFGESPVLQVFATYEEAYKQFGQYVVEAYRHLKECNYVVDESFVEKTTEKDLFKCYNIFEWNEDSSWNEWKAGYDEFMASLPEMDVQWIYDESPGESASWQMYAVNIPYDEQIPILPGLYIKKREIQTNNNESEFR